ncbi:MAG: hypothetical protein HQM08_20450 [Candidatus Riflebacteria bacterium]|nr:hypothetical protein [Candidatus Riflebacteria bacterium]
MKKKEFGFLDYLSEAFNAKYVFPLMGAIPINKVLLAGFGLLGLGNPGFWFLGGALELGYLWLVSTNPQFQNSLRAKQYDQEKLSETNELSKLATQLDDFSNNKMKALNKNLSEIGELMDSNSEAYQNFARESKLQSLNQLSVVFLKLLISKKLIKDSLHLTNLKEIKLEIAELTKQLNDSSVSETLKHSLQGNLEIRQKRLENFSHAEENLRLVDLELERIENQVQLIREQIALNQTPEGLSSSIDIIGSTMTQTEEWIQNNSAFFARIETEKYSSPQIEKNQ